MIRSVTLLFILALAGALRAQDVNKKISVLFLGNSYTYVNSLPQLVHDLAASNNDTLDFDSNTLGGYTLQNHAADATSLAKINSKIWNYVVLQAQSQEPSLDPTQVAVTTTPYALKLDSTIKQNNPCTITTLYETWGRKYGDASNCGLYPPVCTYAGMQDRLKQSYKLFADTTKGIFAPCGEAFRLSRMLDSTIDLYQSDLSHPSLEGSYLAACVFYETLFHKNVTGNAFIAGLSPTVSSFLQQVAHTVVTDSLKLYNLGVNAPYAPFTYASSNLQFNFTSTAGISHAWYFGDGGSSTQSNPVYTYAAAGTYTVSHVVWDVCNRDSSVQVITAMVSGISTNESSLRIYPNPVKDVLFMDGNILPGYIEVISVNGIKTRLKGNKTIDVSALPAGNYYMRCNNGLMLRFIKE